MSLSGTQSVDRRDAAIAAALCGAVVVLLAYSAGVGLQVPGVLSVAPPTSPEQRVVVPPQPAPIAQIAVPQPMLQVSFPGPAAQPPPHEHVQPTPSPRPTPEPTSPSPDNGRSCEPGVLSAIPATEPVASLVATLVRAMPVLNPLAAPPEPEQEPEAAPGPLSCLVGGLVATQCCTAVTAGSEAGR